MGLVFSTDGGWIAVDEFDNYDPELQAEIDAAAAASGVAERDLAMNYRPTLTTGADGGVSASFSPTISDPVITMENMARGYGDVGTSTATNTLLAAINKAAQEQNIQLGPEPAAANQSTGPKLGDRSQNAQGQITIWDGTAWVIEDPSVNVDIGFDKQLSQAQTEAAQYLSEAISDLEGRDGRLPADYHDRLVKLSHEYTNGNLTAEQVQQYVDMLGTTAVKGFDSIFKGNTNSLEGFLSDVHGSWNIGTGPDGLDRWARESLGYTTATTIETKSADITKNLDKIAGGAQDVNGFIEGLLEGTMELGFTWAQTLDEVAQALIDNKTAWATGNDGAGYPGLSGRIGDLNSFDDVKQWLHGIYGGFDNDTKTRLVSAYPNKGPDLSNVYSTFAIAAAPSTAIPAPGDTIPAPGDTIPAPGDTIPAPGDTIPTPGIPMPTSTGTGIYDPFFEDAQRPFSTVYDPYTATQPGYNMPGIQRAYASARNPLKTQYSMQLPDLQVPGGGIGLDPKYQSADEFLRSLTAGTGQILRGGDLYSRLQDISGALSIDPMGIGTDPQAKLYQDRFGTTAEQKAAFSQPFLMATRGSPEARSALNLAINQAAQRFEYQNPQGVPMAGGGQQGFLGWAMENNLLGINDMFTAQQRNPANQSMPISDQFRGTGSDLTFSPDWNTYQYQE
jgi:hypothetical protein